MTNQDPRPIELGRWGWNQDSTGAVMVLPSRSVVHSAEPFPGRGAKMKRPPTRRPFFRLFAALLGTGSSRIADGETGGSALSGFLLVEHDRTRFALTGVRFAAFDRYGSIRLAGIQVGRRLSQRCRSGNPCNGEQSSQQNAEPRPSPCCPNTPILVIARLNGVSNVTRN